MWLCFACWVRAWTFWVALSQGLCHGSVAFWGVTWARARGEAVRTGVLGVLQGIVM